MATLEDKILGNKLHNYCSSSEDEDSNECETSDVESHQNSKHSKNPASLPEVNSKKGTSSNTGPKGVIKDFQNYEKEESEKRIQEACDKIALMNRMTLTVKSALEEEKENAELAELLDDEFLQNYQKQKMQEMLEQMNPNFKFGELIHLSTGQEFLDAIDKEHQSVKVIVHIFENNMKACRVMNNCLKKLCKIYTNVKFCYIVSSTAGMTNKFKIEGVPALLIYKSGSLIGNFVKLSEEFGTEFTHEDVQQFLVEHGMLEDKYCVPSIVKDSVDSDSD